MKQLHFTLNGGKSLFVESANIVAIEEMSGKETRIYVAGGAFVVLAPVSYVIEQFNAPEPTPEETPADEEVDAETGTKKKKHK